MSAREQRSRPSPRLPPWLATELPFTRRLVTVPIGGGDTVDVHLLEHGDARGRPVVFVHGNRSWSITWRQVMARSEGFRSIALDLPGLGLSGPLPPRRRTLDGYGETVTRLLELLAVQDALFVAHEVGGMVVAAAGRRTDFAGGVLVGSALLPTGQQVPHTLHRFGRWPRLRDAAFAVTGRPRLALAALQSRRAEFAASSAALYAWPLGASRRRAMVSLAALAADPAARSAAGEWLLDFPGPLALVWGHRDPLMTADDFATQERELPYARIWRTEAGHFVQEEEAATVGEALAWTAERVGIAADPEGVPPNLLPGIGRGDFVEVGRAQVRRSIEHGGLRPGDRILDLGCGLGRTAAALRDFMSENGRYHGIDVVRDVIRWCQQNLTRVDRRLRFHHAPVRNELYSPAGAVEARQYRIRFAGEFFDFVIAESLFTHLEADDARHYLAEIGRVLRPGGTLCVSVFLLDDEARRAIAERRSDHRFEATHGVARTERADQPLLAVAFDGDWFRAALAAAGLEPASPPLPGAWRGTGGIVSYQDTIVARKVAAPGSDEPKSAVAQ